MAGQNLSGRFRPVRVPSGPFPPSRSPLLAHPGGASYLAPAFGAGLEFRSSSCGGFGSILSVNEALVDLPQRGHFVFAYAGKAWISP